MTEPSNTISFEFRGKAVEARPGDTVASALYRSGQRIFTRSFKYHRPRGLLCLSGKCPNCMMNVDGVPNVRVCMTPVRAGLRVRHQNASPSLEHDRLAIVQRFDWLMVNRHRRDLPTANTNTATGRRMWRLSEAARRACRRRWSWHLTATTSR
jgi:predicted molibdopterin-dependent oxidoreductase YjgC